MLKVGLIIFLSLLIAGLIFSFYYFNKKEIVTGDSIVLQEGYNSATEKVYQGAVRPTDDEPYFRETGITKEFKK